MDAKAGIKADRRQERFKAADKNVLGAFDRSVQEAKEIADGRELREDQREQRNDKRKALEAAENRELKKMDLAAERQLRADDRAADYADEDRREQRRIQERKEERAHDLAMMQCNCKFRTTPGSKGTHYDF